MLLECRLECFCGEELQPVSRADCGSRSAYKKQQCYLFLLSSVFMLVPSVALVVAVAGSVLATRARGLVSNHSSALNITSSLTQSHAWNATTTTHSSLSPTSYHSVPSPTGVPSTFSGNTSGKPETGTIVTITTASLYNSSSS